MLCCCRAYVASTVYDMLHASTSKLRWDAELLQEQVWKSPANLKFFADQETIAPGTTQPTPRKAGSACYALLQGTYEKLKSEVPKYKMITPSVLSDRLRVRLHFCCLLFCQAVQGAAVLIIWAAR